MMRGKVDGIFNGTLRAWAWDPEAPATRLRCDVIVDAVRLGSDVADRPRADLVTASVGDGSHGLMLPVPAHLQDGTEHLVTLEAEAADGTRRTIHSGRLLIPRPLDQLAGRFERVEDGVAIGWVWDRNRPGETIVVELFVGDRPVGAGEANHFRSDLLRAGIGAGGHGFRIRLAQDGQPFAGGTEIVACVRGGYGGWRVGRLQMPEATHAAKRSDPPRAQERIRRAREAEAARDLPKAARLLDEVLATSPTDFDAIFIRSRVALALSDPELARGLAMQALRLKPSHPRPSTVLARLESGLGRHEEAVGHWANVPPGDHCYRERLIRCSRSLLALGRPFEALRELLAAVRLDASDADALRLLGETYEALGATSLAAARWRQYLQLRPDEGAAKDRLARLERPAAPAPALANPLRGAALADWRHDIFGVAAGGYRVEAAKYVLVEALDRDGRVCFGPVEPQEWRPGDLPDYALWLSVDRGSVEVLYAVDPNAGGLLRRGLRMGIEAWAPGAGDRLVLLEIALIVGDWHGAKQRRSLLRSFVGAHRRMARFDLTLASTEFEALGRGELWLAVRCGGAGTFILRAARPVQALDLTGQAKAASIGFEAESLTGSLDALGGAFRLPEAVNCVTEIGAPVDTSLPFTTILLRPHTASAEAILCSTRAALSRAAAPAECVVLTGPGTLAPVLKALREEEGCEPRLRVVTAAETATLAPWVVLLDVGAEHPERWLADLHLMRAITIATPTAQVCGKGCALMPRDAALLALEESAAASTKAVGRQLSRSDADGRSGLKGTSRVRQSQYAGIEPPKGERCRGVREASVAQSAAPSDRQHTKRVRR